MKDQNKATGGAQSSHVLPADPEEMNDERAGWADAAISAFMTEMGCDLGDAVCDLVANIGHWFDRRGDEVEVGATFAHEVRRGFGHYMEETEGQGAQFEGLGLRTVDEPAPVVAAEIVAEVAADQSSDIARAHIALSEALENPDAGNDEVRDAAISMCDALNALQTQAKACAPVVLDSLGARILRVICTEYVEGGEIPWADYQMPGDTGETLGQALKAWHEASKAAEYRARYGKEIGTMPVGGAVEFSDFGGCGSALLGQLRRVGFVQHGPGGWFLTLGAGLELWVCDGSGGHPGASCCMTLENEATGHPLFHERMGASVAALMLADLPGCESLPLTVDHVAAIGAAAHASNQATADLRAGDQRLFVVLDASGTVVTVDLVNDPAVLQHFRETAQESVERDGWKVLEIPLSLVLRAETLALCIRGLLTTCELNLDSLDEGTRQEIKLAAEAIDGLPLPPSCEECGVTLGDDTFQRENGTRVCSSCY